MAKTGPRCPRHAQKKSKMAKMDPKVAQDRSKTAQDSLKASPSSQMGTLTGPGKARRARLWEPGGNRGTQEDPGGPGSQEDPGNPGGARRSQGTQKDSGGPRRTQGTQEDPGGPRSTQGAYGPRHLAKTLSARASAHVCLVYIYIWAEAGQYPSPHPSWSRGTWLL